MQAILVERPGPLSALRLGEAPLPQPGPGQLRVRVQAVGLNPVDYQLARHGHPAWRYPHVLGLDAAGTIDALGDGVAGWRPGDAVYYHGDLSRPGCFAEYALVAAHVVAPLPAGLSFAGAAALPCAGFTAYQALHRRLHVQPSQTILVQGGAGGVGGFAVQLAAHAGLRVIATASPRNFDWVRRLGAHEVIDYHTEDVVARVRALTGGRGVDAIVDTVSAESATAGLRMLAFGGGIACVAGLADLSRLAPFTIAPSVHEIALGGAHLSGDRRSQEDLARIGRELGELCSAGGVQPMVEEVVELAGIPAALERLAAHRVRGKLVAAVAR